MENEENQNPLPGLAFPACDDADLRRQVSALRLALEFSRRVSSIYRELTKEQAERIRQMHALHIDMFLLYLGMSLTCVAYACRWPALARPWFNLAAAGAVIIRMILRRAAVRRKEKP